MNFDDSNIAISFVDYPLSFEDSKLIPQFVSKEQISVFSDKRLHEFVAGRLAAQRACEKLGYKLDQLNMKKDRSPNWPSGIVGSISHSSGLAGSIISKSNLSVGLDIESLILEDRFERIQKRIANSRESDIIRTGQIGKTLIFSAKEALFKLIYPLTNTFFGFEDATLLGFDDKSFSLELHSKKQEIFKHNRVYNGFFNINNEKVVTYLTI